VRREQGDEGPEDDTRSVRVYDYFYTANRSLQRFVDNDANRVADGDQSRTTIVTRDAAEGERFVDEQTGADTAFAYDEHTGVLEERRTDGTVTGTRGADGTVTGGGGYAGGEAKVTTFTHDSLGRELTMTVDPDPDPESDVENRVTRSRWHDSGHLHERTKPNGTVDEWSYDALGQRTRHRRLRRDADGDVTATREDQSYEYDDNGNRTLDERGEHAFNARDQHVRWVRRDDRGHAEKRGWTTAYTLDGSGQVRRTEERDETGVLRIETDAEIDGERLVSSRTTDRTQAVVVHTSQSYRYDDAGNVQRVYTQVDTDGNAVIDEPPVDQPAIAAADCPEADDTATSRVTRYCYDEFFRQTFSSGSGVTDPAHVSHDGLDRRDRRTLDEGPGGEHETRTYRYVGLSELLSSENVTDHVTAAESRRDTALGDRAGGSAALLTSPITVLAGVRTLAGRLASGCHEPVPKLPRRHQRRCRQDQFRRGAIQPEQRERKIP
jgi:YD repeat-containing protein